MLRVNYYASIKFFFFPLYFSMKLFVFVIIFLRKNNLWFYQVLANKRKNTTKMRHNVYLKRENICIRKQCDKIALHYST